MIALYKTSVYFSTDESCMMCHVHPHVENSWKLSKHVNNGSGVKTHCVACHLPPQTNTWKHYSAKAKLGMKDVWSYLTKDSADFNWETKSELEHAVKYIHNESCKECHQNLFPEGITDDGVTAHLYYDENEKKLDLQCISCHLDAGHYNPNYNHSKMVGIPGQNTSGATSIDTSLFFKEPTTVTSFTDYVEQIPGTMVSFNMIAIPGDTSESTISGIIADEMAIGMVNQKTTAVRVIPVIGKGVGEKVEFGGLLGYAPVMPVNPFSCEAFVSRTGRIPAPIHSFKN